jgi:hypothetical protein
MPLLTAALQRMQAAALERHARVLGFCNAQIVDQVVDLVQRRRVAGEEAGDLSPPGGRNRVTNDLALPDPARDLDALGLCTCDRIPQRLLARHDIIWRREKMMRLELGQVGRCMLLVERAALRCDEVPAPQVGPIPTRGRSIGQLADPVDKIVGEFLDPSVFQVYCNAVAREREAKEVDEAPLLGPALDPAAPILRRTQRITAQRLDLVAVLGFEVVVALDRARTDVTPGMCFQHGTNGALDIAAPRFARFQFLAHELLQTWLGVPA